MKVSREADAGRRWGTACLQLQNGVPADCSLLCFTGGSGRKAEVSSQSLAVEDCTFNYELMISFLEICIYKQWKELESRPC